MDEDDVQVPKPVDPAEKIREQMPAFLKDPRVVKLSESILATATDKKFSDSATKIMQHPSLHYFYGSVIVLTLVMLFFRYRALVKINSWVLKIPVRFLFLALYFCGFYLIALAFFGEDFKYLVEKFVELLKSVNSVV